ncbi:MAG: extracellular solute-binding protein [Thaumarchaeota archaeon]|nr:extracellular solute-binding protein [Nitrososphaerota archaeon]
MAQDINNITHFLKVILMANIALVAAVVAILISAGSIGYTTVAVSSDVASIRNRADLIATDINSLKSTQSQVSSDVNQLKSGQQSVSAEQTAIKNLVDQRIGGLEKALADAKKAQEALQKQLEEREELLKEVSVFDPDLVAAASREGGLTIYSVRDQADVLLFIQEFQKQFPNIKANFLSATNPELISRISAEIKGGQMTWDIYDSAVSNCRQAIELGATQPYKSPQATEKFFPPIFDPNGHMSFFGATIPVVMYNTNLVKGDKLALLKSLRTWEDLTKPEVIQAFKGNILMDHPSRGGPHTQVLAEMQTLWNDDARWQNYMKKLLEYEPRLFKSTSQIFRLLTAEEGQVAIIGLAHDVLRERKIGVPVDYISLAPVTLNPSCLVVAKLAPHPSAAKLFVEFMMSPNGQATFSKTLRSPMRLGFAAESSIDVLFPGVPPAEMVGIRNEEAHFIDLRGWLDKWIVPIFGPA